MDNTSVPKLDHLSPSSISTWLDSPLRWKQHYIDGLSDGYSESLHRGLVVHDVLEQYFRLRLVGESPSNIIDWAKSHVPETWAFYLKQNNADFETDEKVLVQAEMLIVDYIEMVGKKLKVLAVEEPFSIPIPGKIFTSLIGRMDLVAELDGKLWVIDFKTSMRKRSMHDVKNDIQAIIYGLAMKHRGNKGDIAFSYHQLLFKKEISIELLDRPVSQAEMRELEEDFLPGFINTLEFQVETGNWFFNPNARWGKSIL